MINTIDISGKWELFISENNRTSLPENYNDSIIEHMAAKYQYVLKAPLETETKDVEKYFMSTVENGICVVQTFVYR
jgi:hypothetical protein